MNWDETDDLGRTMPSGSYLLRLRSGAEVQTDKTALVR